MKKIIVLSSLFCLFTMGADIPYECVGTLYCGPDCQSELAECSLSGTAAGPTTCQFTTGATFVTCKVLQGTTIIGETTAYCLRCGDPGGGIGGGDPDPTWCSLNWWICDPFAY
jgi:hypothetical protein